MLQLSSIWFALCLRAEQGKFVSLLSGMWKLSGEAEEIYPVFNSIGQHYYKFRNLNTVIQPEASAAIPREDNSIPVRNYRTTMSDAEEILPWGACKIHGLFFSFLFVFCTTMQQSRELLCKGIEPQRLKQCDFLEATLYYKAFKQEDLPERDSIYNDPDKGPQYCVHVAGFGRRDEPTNPDERASWKQWMDYLLRNTHINERGSYLLIQSGCMLGGEQVENRQLVCTPMGSRVGGSAGSRT